MYVVGMATGETGLSNVPEFCCRTRTLANHRRYQRDPRSLRGQQQFLVRERAEGRGHLVKVQRTESGYRRRRGGSIGKVRIHPSLEGSSEVRIPLFEGFSEPSRHSDAVDRLSLPRQPRLRINDPQLYW